MKRRWVYDKNGKSREVSTDTVSEGHFVQPDLVDFRSPDGAYISGRRQWREHLKSTGTVETSPQDLMKTQQSWNAKKAAFQDRLKPAAQFGVRGSDAPVLSAPTYERSRINSEVANRLDGRPTPDRKTLIKLTLDMERALSRRS